MHSSLRTSSIAFALSLIALFRSEAAFPPVALKAVCVGQIHSPTTITFAPDNSGRLFICDQLGRIYIFQGGMLLPTPFLNIASTGNTAPWNGPGPVVTVGTGYSERGLLGLAFHPGFANPLSPGYGRFYINYNKSYVAGSDPGPPQVGDPVNCVTVIAEYRVSATDPNLADPTSERRVLVFTQPQSNHNGGQLEFGPDGYLYIGSGDGGSSEDNAAGHTGGSAAKPANCLGNAMDRTRLLGKILRIDPLDPDGAGPLSYSIPATNPFVGAGGGIREEIYAWGLRNPWRFSFDWRPGGTNRLFCGDVGQGRTEEIDIIVSGGNYGWRYKEGAEFPSFSSGAGTNPMPDPGFGPYFEPIAAYAHPGAVTVPPLPQLGLSVTGGFVYRGSAIPALQGKYVFGDYGSTAGASDGRMMGLEETAPLSGVFTLTQALPMVGIPLAASGAISNQRILCLGEDASGEIYIGLKSNSGVLALSGGLPAGSIWKIVPPASTSLPAIGASKDNTIFSDGEPGVENGNSNGVGPNLFAGWASPNGYQARRALLAFDLSSVPANSRITSAAVYLLCDKQAQNSPVSGPFNLHKLTADWGEGFSDSEAGGQPGLGAAATIGDATWRLRLVSVTGSPPTGTAWTTPGGDYVASASATTTVANASVNPYVWTSNQNAKLAADVNEWLAAPATNFGWILIGPEGDGAGATAKRFVSRDTLFNPDGAPKLYLSYATPPPPTHFETWLATYFPTNLVGQYVNPGGDLDGDNIFNLIEYAFGFSPLAANLPPNAGLEITTAPSGPNTVLTITFRRDPRATDLNYYLESGNDLVGWTIITQSLAGGVPTGIGYQSEAVVDAPIRQVTATRTLATPAKHFVRLRVTQQ